MRAGSGVGLNGKTCPSDCEPHHAEGNLLQALIYNSDALYYSHYHAIGESWRWQRLAKTPGRHPFE